MHETIFAHTEPGTEWPAYVNLRKDGDRYLLTVRTRGSDTPAEMELTEDDLTDMAADILNHFNPVSIGEAMSDQAC